MFAPDRQGFFAGLWVQFLQELLDVDKVEFRKITTKEERFTWMYNNRFVKVKVDDNKYEYDITYVVQNRLLSSRIVMEKLGS